MVLLCGVFNLVCRIRCNSLNTWSLHSPLAPSSTDFLIICVCSTFSAEILCDPSARNRYEQHLIILTHLLLIILLHELFFSSLLSSSSSVLICFTLLYYTLLYFSSLHFTLFHMLSKYSFRHSITSSLDFLSCRLLPSPTSF
jgi:hypothetical protein